MKYCDKCKVEVENHLKYCPLCGRCVDENEIVDDTQHNYPKVERPPKSNYYTINFVFWILLLINILVVCLELVISTSINYFWHTLAGSLVVCCGVLYPKKHNWNNNSTISCTMIMLSGYMLFLELYTNSYGWGIRYAIPLFVFLVALFEILMVCLRKFNRLEQIITIFLCFCEELGIFIYNFATKNVIWPSLMGTFALFTFLFVLFVVRYKKTRKELHKGLHI